MSQKPPVDLAVWQWALIGSGATLVLAFAAYGAVSFVSPNNNCVANSNSLNPNTNASTPNRNVAESSPFDLRMPSLPNPMGSFQNQSNKAKQSEAKTYTGTMNKGQQAFYLEKEKFGENVEALGLGIKTETENYIYRTYARNDANSLRRMAFQIGQSKKADLRSYVGAVWVTTVGSSRDIATYAILCETNNTGTAEPPLPIVASGGMMECASGTTAIQ